MTILPRTALGVLCHKQAGVVAMLADQAVLILLKKKIASVRYQERTRPGL